jgi:hypothetical protein
MTNPVTERRCVLLLTARLNRPISAIASGVPPAPDVRVTYADGSAEAFEITEIHPDELPDGGSEARALEMRRAKGDPSAIAASWVAIDALPALRRRIEQKARKSRCYEVLPGDLLSLLLVGSVPEIGALASTYIFAPQLPLDRLNGEIHELLAGSRFQRAYLHLPLSGNAVWGWTRQTRWSVLRVPEDTSKEGRETLEALRGLGNGVLLPGTKLFGWPR